MTQTPAPIRKSVDAEEVELAQNQIKAWLNGKVWEVLDHDIRPLLFLCGDLLRDLSADLQDARAARAAVEKEIAVAYRQGWYARGKSSSQDIEERDLQFAAVAVKRLAALPQSRSEGT